ncbi:MAG: hypothetical protein LBK66_11915 [Spirochaetaceae bacterium]|nr:hypothetical protein [Spirochaetaceae bacterium]
MRKPAGGRGVAEDCRRQAVDRGGGGRDYAATVCDDAGKDTRVRAPLLN